MKINKEKLKQAREQAFFSQKDLANATGLSTVTICHLERYDRGGTPRTIGKVCKALEISINEIL